MLTFIINFKRPASVVIICGDFKSAAMSKDKRYLKKEDYKVRVRE